MPPGHSSSWKMTAKTYGMTGHGLRLRRKSYKAVAADLVVYFCTAIYNFEVLEEIITSYVNHPVLLILLRNALRRTETCGGIFYEYQVNSIPMGSPLSPLLGAIVLLPLDQAMSKIKNVSYTRYMDDWAVFTKHKSALRKVVKTTHRIVNDLKLRLHPSKTFIGKISRGFNFLGYYMDDKTILPSKETVRRFQERATAHYVPSQANENVSHRHKRKATDRNISEYLTIEAAPTDADFVNIMTQLSAAAQKNGTAAKLRMYVQKWTRWLRNGLGDIFHFEACVRSLMPSIADYWTSMSTASASIGLVV